MVAWLAGRFIGSWLVVGWLPAWLPGWYSQERELCPADSMVCCYVLAPCVLILNFLQVHMPSPYGATAGSQPQQQQQSYQQQQQQPSFKLSSSDGGARAGVGMTSSLDQPLTASPSMAASAEPQAPLPAAAGTGTPAAATAPVAAPPAARAPAAAGSLS